MQVYATKWALTKGIIKISVQQIETDPGTVFTGSEFLGRKDWYEDFQSARERAEYLRSVQIRALLTQIGKISRIDFSQAHE